MKFINSPVRRDAVEMSLFSLKSWLIVLFVGLSINVVGHGPRGVSGQARSNMPPSFVNGGDLSKVSVPEDTSVGSVVYRLKGMDPEGGELTYSISGEYLRVNKKSGDLTLIKALDREAEPKIDVIISLTDDGFGSEPSTVSLRREIYIQDRNDNPPIFHKRPYTFKVVERARVGSTVFADIPITDADFGINAQVNLTCSYEDTPLACRTFNVASEKVGDGKYIGIISLAIPLDYETHSSYAMTMKASDGVNNATAMVTISVQDLQDQAPKFYGGPYVFKVKENAPAGTKVGEISVQDADVGNPRALQLRLIDEADNEYFRLNEIQRDPYTGTYTAVVETTNNTLDAEDEFIRENLGVYELILEARELPLDSDDLEPTLTTRTGMAVMVKDEDDHIPEFRPSTFTRILKIPYNAGESWTFPDFRVEVEDGDVDSYNSKFELKFDWNLENHKVPVDKVFHFVTPTQDNPTIQSKGIITMEVTNVSLLSPGVKIDLQIGAYQKGHLVSNLNVPIEVASGPKILPAFSQNVYKLSVPEDIPEGGLIAKISARNHDEIDGVKYTLIGAAAERFSVDENTGEIRCKLHCLDFEKDKSHFFLIRAKAGDAVDEEVFALFHLDVLEKNDNRPEFVNVPGIMTQTANGNVMKRAVQDGADKFDPPFLVKALDPDSDDKITYSVNDHSMSSSGITIDPETGELLLTKPLRWSESGEHKLTVTATDTTGKFSIQQVLLVVQAVQNIPPTFPYQVEQIQVPETLQKGSQVLTVKAHDPDGQDASIKYSIDYQPMADLFVIEEGTGTIRLNGDLDYDFKQRVYRVQVRAEDEGKPSESAKAFVEIAILPVNDESPKFLKNTYSAEISETSPKHSKVMTLKAKDIDEDADLEYGLACPCQTWDASGSMGSSEDAEKFFKSLSINPENGEVILQDTFSHKQTAVLEFIASVVDRNGITFQNDSAAVTLYITAAERNKPIFGHPWSIGSPWINLTIPEDLDVETAVVDLNAWDYVAGKAVTDFELELDSSNFGLNGSQLVVISELDYELQDMYILQVKAKDERGGESIANLGIQISDINDHSPSFFKPEYKGKVTENAIFPTPIITLEASDLDDPSNYGAIRYALTGPQSDLFTIDTLAGIVQVAPGAIIDREKDETHKITVLAMDTPSGGPFQRTATATLHIIVVDENDNDPICDTEDYLVPENAPVGTFIGFVDCKDVDKNPNITFRLVDDHHLNLFAIDKNSGKLSVAKSLRARGRNAPYVISLIVEDGKERFVSLSIGIKVSNVIPNDGRPQFVHDTFNATILEGAPRGTQIIQVKGHDTDAFDNGEGQLSYHLLKQLYPCHSKTLKENEHRNIVDVELFRLDEQSGSLTLKDAIDREKMECFSLLISVEDSGTPPQSDSAWFEIHVVDVDDSLPYLSVAERNVKLVLNESTPIGSIVHHFSGVDEDLAPNNLITFDISGGGSDLFQVVSSGPQTANLVLNVDLAQMEHDDLTLVVKCHPTGKKISVPDCISKVNIKVTRDSVGSGGGGGGGGEGNKYKLNSKTKYYEMIVGAASGSPIGNLIGNAGMPKRIHTSTQMYHPKAVGSSPTNVSELIHIDEDTGDIFVWDNLEKYSNGHLRVQMVDEDGGMKKNLKVFIAPNEHLLHASMIEYSKLRKWVEETDAFLNSPHNKSGGGSVKMGQFHVLTFDQSNAPDGKTRVCFQLLENENMVSQDKAMKILENGDLQDLFLKYTIDEVHRGCPSRPRAPARLSLVTAGTGRFWVERSLLGIASVVAIACISSILILCLLNRNRGKR